MADFEGIPLRGIGGSGGALLYLRESAESDIVENVASGVEVQALGGSRAIVVRGLTENSYEEVMSVAPEYANQALDLISMGGRPATVLADVRKTHVAWWETEEGSTVRLSGAAKLMIGMGGAAVEAPPMRSWHASMRYFRMSQTTDDLYDAFRNVYLALESLLSRIEPVRVGAKGNPEAERTWLKRALSAASSLVNLSNYVIGETANPADAVFSELYEQIRTSIFHAKNGRPVLLPQDQAHRKTVAAAKERYTRLYLDLATKELDVVFTSGAITTAGFSILVEPALAQLRLYVTDDPGTGGEADTAISPADCASVALVTRRAAHLDRPEELALAVVGEADVATVQEVIPHIARFCATGPTGEPVHIESLEGKLNLSGFAMLECALIVQGVNVELPKASYGT
jgi:hypothetical protein